MTNSKLDMIMITKIVHKTSLHLLQIYNSRIYISIIKYNYVVC